MNDNVGDMPIEIFCDYIQDMTGEEWTLQHFIPLCRGKRWFSDLGFGDNVDIDFELDTEDFFGDGVVDLYYTNYGNGSPAGYYDCFGVGDINAPMYPNCRNT